MSGASSRQEGDEGRPAGLRFHAAMVKGSDRLKKEIGYNPTRFSRWWGNLEVLKRPNAYLALRIHPKDSQNYGRQVAFI